MTRYSLLLLVSACCAGSPDGRRDVETGQPTGLPPASSGRGMMMDLPRLSDPRIVTTANGGGTWHFKNGKPRDNFGDGQMGIVEVGNHREYWLMMRMGTPPPGGVFFRKKYDGNPYEWGPVSRRRPVKALPGAPPHSHGNIDTHVFAQNPLTGVTTFLHGVKPGWRKPSDGRGQTFAIQRATATDPPRGPAGFTRYFDELLIAPHPDAPWEQPRHDQARDVWFGGSGESSLVMDPPVAVVFWEAKTSEGPDAFGQRFRGRLGRAECDLETFDEKPVMVRTPPPGPRSYVFDPADDPRYRKTDKGAVWGTAHVTLQAHVSINPLDGSYHMVALNSKPNKGTGEVNRRTGIGHWWSHDKGFTWRQDSRNPLIDWESMGWKHIGIGHRLNSPWLMWDVDEDGKGVVYLGFWGNGTGAQNKLGTRLYLCEASLDK
jgi:hypothetical protein